MVGQVAGVHEGRKHVEQICVHSLPDVLEAGVLLVFLRILRDLHKKQEPEQVREDHPWLQKIDREQQGLPKFQVGDDRSAGNPDQLQSRAYHHLGTDAENIVLT